MPIQEYSVRLRGGLWEVSLGGRLLSGQQSHKAALTLAEGLAHAGSLRGERWKIVIADDDDTVVE